MKPTCPSLSDLQAGDRFLYYGRSYVFRSQEGTRFWCDDAVSGETSLFTYDAEVDWLEG